MVTAVAASLALSACGTNGSADSTSSGVEKLSGAQRSIAESEIPLPQLQENPQPQGEASVSVCQDVDFKAGCNASVYAKSANGTFENRISSIRNTNNFSITFYDNVGFSGDSITLKPGEETRSLNPEGAEQGINDRISSWQPQVESHAGEKSLLTVCTDNDLGGRCEEVPVFGGGAKLNDNISSIQNTSEFDVMFYADNECKGPGVMIPSHAYVRTLDPEGVNSGLNDRISSWQPVLSS
ncbi:hypothetical protein ACFW9I_37210 [[Kitasatospora] papulosa]|uniref:hypothetical protein n=1 Tax=[Kitasatospora] papulosa TaxID=1464011 RepID=UPI0036BEADBA